MPQGHYFDPDPAVGSRPGTVHLALPDLDGDLAVDRGVFSSTRVDPGTLVLLRALPPLPDGSLLDLGCGYGPIACVLGRRFPAAQVIGIDVNRRARELTAANAAAWHVGNVQVAAPDEVDPTRTFDAIVSNPPIRVGKDALHGLLLAWLPRLAPGGSAWLVVQRHLGADSLAGWLDSQGYPTARVSSKKGYRVLRVHAAPSATEGHGPCAS